MEKGIRSSIMNILLWIPLILFVIPGFLVLWLYKKVFTFFVVKLFQPNYRPPNDITDTTMCQGSSYDYPNTNAAQVWVVDGPWITASEFSDHFYKCFLEGNSEKYRNLLAYVTTYGTYSFYAHCQPNELDLTWHIREYKIEEYGQGTLNSWAVTWMTTNTFETGRPVWQVAILHLTNPLSGAQETGIVAKFSHSLVDGYSFVHMVGKLTDNPAPYIVADKTDGWKDKLKYVYNAPQGLLSFTKNQAFSSDSQSPYKKIARTAITKGWLMSFATLNLETVKLIRKASNSHFASLMVAAQMGALRRLLLESKKEEELPEKLWVASSMPWPNHPMKLTNHWTMGFFKCPVRIADPLERAHMTEAFYQDFKSKEIEPMIMYGLMPAVRLLPTWAVRLWAHHDPGLTNVNSFFASLMQSSKKHYLLGRPVKKLYLPLAIPDVSPMMTLYGVTTSHSGQIDLSISACTGAMVKSQEELDRLTQVYFIEELDSIAALCGLKCASVAVDDAHVGSGKGSIDLPTITAEVANNKEITSKTTTTPML